MSLHDDDVVLREQLQRLAGRHPDDDAAYLAMQRRVRTVKRRRGAVAAMGVAALFVAGAAFAILGRTDSNQLQPAQVPNDDQVLTVPVTETQGTDKIAIVDTEPSTSESTTAPATTPTTPPPSSMPTPNQPLKSKPTTPEPPAQSATTETASTVAAPTSSDAVHSGGGGQGGHTGGGSGTPPSHTTPPTSPTTSSTEPPTSTTTDSSNPPVFKEETRTCTAEVGSITVHLATDGALSLVSQDPNPGFVSGTSDDGPSRVRVRFFGSGQSSDVVAVVSHGHIVCFPQNPSGNSGPGFGSGDGSGSDSGSGGSDGTTDGSRGWPTLPPTVTPTASTVATAS